MNALDYIKEKYNLETPYESIIEIPNVDRNDLAFLLRELDFKKGVEIGVEQGLYSEVLCKANPQMKIYGVDPWKSYNTCETTSETENEGFIEQKKCDKFYEEAKKRLSSYPNYKIIKKTSIEAANEFPDGSLDFVYIDGDHEYSHVLSDITTWIKKLRPGGIISGHDYYIMANKKVLMHVKQAVNYYVETNEIKPLIILGAREKIPGEKRDRWRSWLWIKK